MSDFDHHHLGWTYEDSPKAYHELFFPSEDYFEWVSYGTAENFQNREFTTVTASEVYKRNIFLENLESFKQMLSEEIPYRIDIGAIYDVKMKKNGKTEMTPVQRELVFDIDANDYDNVRTCCTGSDICQKCWKYLAMACEILHSILTEDFNFELILWTFSGRRGIHGWVCDDDIRNADEDVRKAVVDFIQLIDCGSEFEKKIHLPEGKISPQIQRAIDIIKPKFVEVCIDDQQLLTDPKQIEKFLNILPEGYVRTEVERFFKKCQTGIDRWNAFVNFVERDDHLIMEGSHLVEEIMLQFCYPRLDSPVTIEIKHLLKSPFSMHPKNSKIAIPFDPKRVSEFNIEDVPTVPGLVDPVESLEKEKMLERFQEAIKIFKEFVKKCTSVRPKAVGKVQNDVNTKLSTEVVEGNSELLERNNRVDCEATCISDKWRIMKKVCACIARTIEARKEIERSEVEEMLEPIKCTTEEDKLNSLKAQEERQENYKREVEKMIECIKRVRDEYCESIESDSSEENDSATGYSSQGSVASNVSNGSYYGERRSEQSTFDEKQEIHAIAITKKPDCSLSLAPERDVGELQTVSMMVELKRMSKEFKESHEGTSNEGEGDASCFKGETRVRNPFYERKRKRDDDDDSGTKIKK